MPMEGSHMQAISNVINTVKDGYLKAVQWVADHPHMMLWIGVGQAVAGFVFLVL